jgi:hypothetical protein
LRTPRVRRAVRGLGRGDVPGLVAILDRQLTETIAACRLARLVAQGTLKPGAAHEQIAEIEHRGDLLRAELVTRLAGVLVAPIDREDLFRLSRSIDDVLDNLRDFVREWDLYEIESADGFLGLLDATESGVADLKSGRAAVKEIRERDSPPVRRRAEQALQRRAHHGSPQVPRAAAATRRRRPAVERGRRRSVGCGRQASGLTRASAARAPSPCGARPDSEYGTSRRLYGTGPKRRTDLALTQTPDPLLMLRSRMPARLALRSRGGRELPVHRCPPRDGCDKNGLGRGAGGLPDLCSLCLDRIPRHRRRRMER